MNFIEKRRLLIAFLLHLRVYYVATTTPSACEKNYQFMCDNKECIAMIGVCDGKSDCSDGSDELKCEGENYPKCKKRYFQCVSSRRCVPFEWRCDDESDCSDGSDEDDCPEGPCSDFTEFECLRNRQCIDEDLHCDGKIDCVDGSDELNCNEFNICYHGRFSCEKDRMCVPRQWLCDGESDCDDGSDETMCASILTGTVKQSCPDNYCMHNAQCVVINGQNHCNCTSDFTGKKCEIRITEEQRYFDDLYKMIGIPMVLAILFVIISLMIFCYYKRRSRNSTVLISKTESQIPITSYSKEMD